MVQRKSEGPSVEGRVPTRSILLAFAIIVGCVLCFFLAVPFIGASTAALTLAVIFAPMQAMLERRLRYRGVAAMISLVVIIVVVAVPASFVIERLVAEAAGNARVIQFRIASGEFQRFMDQHPRLAPIGRWIADQVDIPSLASGMATWLSNLGASFVRGSLVQVAVIGLTFYLLFYFLRDRKEARALLIDLLPLTPAESDRVFGRVIDTVRAIVYGTMAVALVQGALGGMMFWLLGIPAALLWGLVMTILSIVPVLGSFVVWIPASVLLAADGRWVHGHRTGAVGCGGHQQYRQHPAPDARRQPAPPAHRAGLHLDGRRPAGLWHVGLHPRPARRHGNRDADRYLARARIEPGSGQPFAGAPRWRRAR